MKKGAGNEMFQYRVNPIITTELLEPPVVTPSTDLPNTNPTQPTTTTAKSTTKTSTTTTKSTTTIQQMSSTAKQSLKAITGNYSNILYLSSYLVAFRLFPCYQSNVARYSSNHW